LSWDQYRREMAQNALRFEAVLDLAAGLRGRLHVDIKEPGYEAEIVRVVRSRWELDGFVVTGADASVRAVKVEFSAGAGRALAGRGPRRAAGLAMRAGAAERAAPRAKGARVPC